MTSSRTTLSGSEDLEALVHENLELRHELRKRKRRVVLRRLRRGSALALPLARAMSHRRTSKAAGTGAAPSGPPETHEPHAGAVHAAVFALVLRRIVADGKPHSSVVPSTPAGAP